MTGGRQSDHALTVNGGGILHLKDDNRFSGGTSILDGATVVVWDSLTSDIHIASPSSKWGAEGPELWLAGSVNGNISNDGIVSLRHTCGTPVYQCVEEHHPVINGDFTQSASGRLEVVPGWSFQITGKAVLDGELRFINSRALNYVLPSAPANILVLHADNGISGRFAEWKSYELFLTGSLRYLPNDIYFDATSISVATAMAAAKADALTIRSATNFDAALGNAGKWASQPGAAFTTTQRQFLASVGAIQHLQDYGQATRTFDSLSGRGHLAAVDALLLQATLPAADLMSRMDQLHDGSRLGAWSGQATTLAPANGTFNAARAGFDQWLGDRLALGVSIGAGDGILRFDGAGGTARDRSPQWDVYAQQLIGDDAYVFGDIGYDRHQLDTRRAIDLGVGQFAVSGMRNLDLLRAYVESGQHFRIGNGQLTLFGGLSHATLQGAGFAEQGVTGFELIAQPSTQQRTSALAGVRLGQAWRTGTRVTTLNLAAGYSQTLHARDDARAAFIGAPDATFALDALPVSRGRGWLQLGLATGNERWNLGLNYDRQASNQAVMLHTRLAF